MSETAGPERAGADLVVDCLAAEGVTHVFGLPGTTIMDLIDALARQDEIRYLSTRHEQVAGFMADGFSRAGGPLGVCLASRGPGAANLAIAVQNAHDESIPMLVLIGQVPSSIVERRSFEEMDVVAAFRPMCKWAVEIHQPQRIPELLQRAVRTAVTGRPGPVVVSLPLDVLQAPAAAAAGPKVRFHPPAPDPAGIAGAPVVTTWLRKNAVPNSHPAFLGPLGYGAPEVSDQLVREADVIVALGCRFSEFTTKRWTLVPAAAQLVHVDIDPDELGRVHPPRVGLISDAAAAARALATALGPLVAADPTRATQRRSRRDSLRKEYEDTAALPPSAPAAGTVSSGALVHAVQDLADRDGIVLVQDVHTFGPGSPATWASTAPAATTAQRAARWRGGSRPRWAWHWPAPTSASSPSAGTAASGWSPRTSRRASAKESPSSTWSSTTTPTGTPATASAPPTAAVTTASSSTTPTSPPTPASSAPTASGSPPTPTCNLPSPRPSPTPAPASSTSSRTAWRACRRASTRRRLIDLFSSGSPFRRRTGTPERYQGAVKTERQDDTADHHGRGAPEHFARFCAAVTARLPFDLSRVVPSTFVGFAAINGFTFGTDLLILTALHSHWGVPYAVAVGVGYAVAFALSFVLNRVLNFRSHGPLGRQTLVYVGVVALNFAILLGVSTGLEAVGVQYQVARVAAGACEGIFMYCAMRWVVFRRSDERVGRPSITPGADSGTVRPHRGRPG